MPPAPPVSPMPSEPFAPTDDLNPADDATPVAVSSTVAAEDPPPPIHLRSLLLDHTIAPLLVSIFYVLDVIYILDHFYTGIGCSRRYLLLQHVVSPVHSESITIKRYHFLPYHLFLEHWGQCSAWLGGELRKEVFVSSVKLFW